MTKKAHSSFTTNRTFARTHLAAPSLAAAFWMASATASQALTLTPPPQMRHVCSNPMPPQSFSAYIDSTIPSDLDPYLVEPPTPTTRIYFSVLLPARCATEHFPLVYNQAAWGTQRIRRQAFNDDPVQMAPEALSELHLLQQLPDYGYAVISVDPRGIGESIPENGGGTQRLMDPNAEIQDARQILDWAYDHADEYGIQIEPATGIPKDIKVGTYGVSYGGGFQMSLAALDARVDTIIPTMTWNDLVYSIEPGEAVKLGWDGVLCGVGQLAGQKYTPQLSETCRTVGLTNPRAGKLRTLHDFAVYLGVAEDQPPTAAALARQKRLEQGVGTNGFPTETEMIEFLEYPGMGYFASRQALGLDWGFGEAKGAAKLRPISALFIQGNSDLLFNLTEGYWNWRYFTAAGGDTRLMSTNGGHNALLTLETGYCGDLNVLDASLAWFGHYLKGDSSDAIAKIPKVCISVSDTIGAPKVANVAVKLSDFPVGSLSGTGAIPAQANTIAATVQAFQVDPTFVPITTITQSGAVLAGAPTMSSINVLPGPMAMPDIQVVALVATGIRRNGQLITVDQQVTGFAQGLHVRTDQFIHQEDVVVLPAVGEQLQPGDEVGLLFYPEHYNFTALTSPQGLVNDRLLINQVIGVPPLPVDFPKLDTLVGLAYINPYGVQISDVGLPIFIPGQYQDSRLTP
jgi:ABC-2 type transport system ATP-binding protein